MTPKTFGTLVLFTGLVACGGRHRGLETAVPTAAANWHAMATRADRVRLRGWREAWTEALDRARRDNAARIAAEGALFDPDQALAGAVPPTGTYRCRVFKLGAKGTAMAEFTSYADFRCRIDAEGNESSFYKLTGAQRPVGTIFHDNPKRAMFLGTLLLGDEVRQMHYGRDPARDLVGYVERLGDKRWRLVLPYPQFESILDVIELVPEG
ncbi:DUF4893 domain-containing protein [Sphingomonas sp. 28-63-12]|uniref:DUF4893 domain-containing protein n=1 Tax=Sphingomonas sp. 28-63-12 TaxID=1970434 RepID=UPI000BD39645|nr:MAG: DUF4893 domain-containing protein [Sphingomonas sp. 28-63-12]